MSGCVPWGMKAFTNVAHLARVAAEVLLERPGRRFDGRDDFVDVVPWRFLVVASSAPRSPWQVKHDSTSAQVGFSTLGAMIRDSRARSSRLPSRTRRSPRPNHWAAPRESEQARLGGGGLVPARRPRRSAAPPACRGRRRRAACPAWPQPTWRDSWRGGGRCCRSPWRVPSAAAALGAAPESPSRSSSPSVAKSFSRASRFAAVVDARQRGGRWGTP